MYLKGLGKVTISFYIYTQWNSCGCNHVFIMLRRPPSVRLLSISNFTFIFSLLYFHFYIFTFIFLLLYFHFYIFTFIFSLLYFHLYIFTFIFLLSLYIFSFNGFSSAFYFYTTMHVKHDYKL